MGVRRKGVFWAGYLRLTDGLSVCWLDGKKVQVAPIVDPSQKRDLFRLTVSLRLCLLAEGHRLTFRLAVSWLAEKKLHRPSTLHHSQPAKKIRLTVARGPYKLDATNLT